MIIRLRLPHNFKTIIPWVVRLSWTWKCLFTPTFIGRRFWPIKLVMVA